MLSETCACGASFTADLGESYAGYHPRTQEWKDMTEWRTRHRCPPRVDTAAVLRELLSVMVPNG